jgi:hypothetical protein
MMMSFAEIDIALISRYQHIFYDFLAEEELTLIMVGWGLWEWRPE